MRDLIFYSLVSWHQRGSLLFSRLLRTIRSWITKRLTPAKRESDGSQWCLVGNIVEQRKYGEGGNEMRPGTKHFSGGTKVYCLPAQWGDGYAQIVVVGKHRGSRNLVTMIVSSDWITNWRAQVVYKPAVVKQLTKAVEEHGRRNWQTKEEVEIYVKSIQDYNAKKAS